MWLKTMPSPTTLKLILGMKLSRLIFETQVNAANQLCHCLQVMISLAREPLNQLTTIILPTAMICAIAFCTNFIPVNQLIWTYFSKCMMYLLISQGEYYAAAVAANLTSLLSLITLFASVNNSLPKTAGLKLVDIW